MKRKHSEIESTESDIPAPLPAKRDSDEPLPKKVRCCLYFFVFLFRYVSSLRVNGLIDKEFWFCQREVLAIETDILWKT